ncbi:MAG TPA: response regulator [Nitrososphaera sp.]|nr:response regulator [Nitrososphaera sp.]
MSKRILVVDDEPVMVRLLQSLLEGWGYTVETTRGGDDALKALDQKAYDGMTLGIFMPMINGLEVLRKLCQTNQSMPVVILSAGYPHLNERDMRFLQDNAQVLLQKPFPLEELKQVVERWFGAPESSPSDSLTEL